MRLERWNGGGGETAQNQSQDAPDGTRRFLLAVIVWSHDNNKEVGSWERKTPSRSNFCCREMKAVVLFMINGGGDHLHLDD
ncbi:hypothetical protein K443DRAFT_303610 [Laccaria amethystina LaAM-08-1]|uniref:Uncharacterized protein n=1 Tax=Laccaria amethystina LaAM-08-1 TaxID=1095629 RepID=A0A0C9XCA5_9AGAR|nr:hypothetical protein K443DRAFT_303610 [Laccaria amethystina LaAM-08-1]